MNNWIQDMIRIFKAVVVIISLLFLIFIFNQFILLYQFMQGLHPILAWFTVLFLGSGILYFLWKIYQLWFHGAKHVVLPENPSKEEYHNYLQTMVDLLKKNPYLQKIDFYSSRRPLEKIVIESFDHLDSVSAPIIRENANAIFLSTAISQNGVLDSLMVLFTILRMVWQLANIYQTRPSLSSLLKLYVQVAGVVLMARTIEDSDLIEAQMEPLITSILGESIASAIPGMVPITNLLVSSLLEGSVNAFLTLRVGMITQAYLGMEVPQSRQSVRRSASQDSLKHMGSIIKENGKIVIRTIANATKKASLGTAKRWFSR